VQGGTVICGAANCLGANAAVPISSGATLNLNGFSQSVASLNANAGSALRFGGTNTLTAASAPALAGAMHMHISKGATLASSKLAVTSGTLTNGGTLTVTLLGAGTLAAGDRFALFAAPAFAGAFAGVSLPGLPDGLRWDDSLLAVNGTITVVSSTPVPPAFTNTVWQGPGGMALTATGGLGQSYVLQSTSDLTSPVFWSPMATNQANPSGVLSFTDPQATNLPRRYYRLAAP
jgi:hypothetical protein